MHLASQMLFNPDGALEEIAGMIPEELREPIARDLATNIGIAGTQPGASAQNPFMLKQMVDLSKPLLQPLHRDPWANEIKKGMGIEPDDFDGFSLLLYGLVSAAITKKLDQDG